MAMRREWLRILIVQDRPDQLASLVNVLGDEGYQVVGARTAAEASEYARCESFAVAVVDVQAPDVSEVSLLSLLKAKNAQIQMILSPAFASLDSAKDVIGESADAYLKRDGSITELLSTLRRTFRDQLTEYTKELEIALAERDERFRQLVGHIKEVFWVFALTSRKFGISALNMKQSGAAAVPVFLKIPEVFGMRFIITINHDFTHTNLHRR